MIVGVLYYRWGYYSYTRTILNQVPDVEYRKTYDYYSILNHAARKINHATHKKLVDTFDLNNQFQDFGLNKVDLLHLFNGINHGKTPWVSTFETLLPRLKRLLGNYNQKPDSIYLGNKEKRALDALCGDACKQLIALSECSRLIQLDVLKRLSININAVESKMTVLHPPQAKKINGYDDKQLDRFKKIRFMLVGAGFFRKGGREVLRVFERLVRKEGYPIELIIISSLLMDQYAAHETEADVAWAKKTIAANEDWITHHINLPNEQVLNLMQSAHVGLLPTYADTYGYSVLEFQANGVPVITTDVRALGEINNNSAGWLINVPKNELGESFYATAEQREQLSASIESGLEKIVRNIFSETESLRLKGIASLEKIERDHDPDDYARRMREIYQGVLR
ncbi:MAG: glycosyltransferase family 4 protein [Chloroflexi bacterium]|nr:glycosyltransferase family 4 protein [Chloroflexota bacterium]